MELIPRQEEKMPTWFREDSLLRQLLEANTWFCSSAWRLMVPDGPAEPEREPKTRGGSPPAPGGPAAAPIRQARSPRVSYKTGQGSVRGSAPPSEPDRASPSASASDPCLEASAPGQPWFSRLCCCQVFISYRNLRPPPLRAFPLGGLEARASHLLARRVFTDL